MSVLKKIGDLKEKTVTSLRTEGLKPFLRKARNYMLKPFMTPPVRGPFPERTRAKSRQELLCITDNYSVKRLNILTNNAHCFFAIDSKILTLIIDFCTKYNYSIRFISRDEPLNPSLIRKTLLASASRLPILDFYFDNDARLSPSVRKLEVSDDDIFFSCSSECDEIIKSTPLPRSRHFSIYAKGDNQLLTITNKTTLEEMKEQINER